MSAVQYKKMPGNLRGFVRRASLWETNDHVLSVTGTRFWEEYRRFYYKDIQALLLYRCARAGSIGGWMVGVVVLPYFCLMLHAWRVGAGWWTVPVALTVWLLYRLVVCLRFSCRCYLQTAVSREELPSLLRIGSAQRALEILRSKIIEAQGPLPDDFEELRISYSGHVSSPLATVLGSGSGMERDSSEKGVRGMWWAVGCFGLLLLNAAAAFWYLNQPYALRASPFLGFMSFGLMLAELATALLSLISIQQIEPLRVVRNWMLVVLAFLGFRICSMMMSTIFLTLQRQMGTAGSILTLQHWTVLADGTLETILGLGGLASLLLKWPDLRRTLTSAD